MGFSHCLLEFLLPPLPSTERGKQTVVDVDPSNPHRIIYAHGKAIYMVDLQDPSRTQAYTEHSHTCTVARFSPSGYYIASGDVTGRVRVWDATQLEHILKGEYQVLGGPIRDLAWDPESKHIIAVGEGREKFAHAFQMDTGSSSGEVIGQTKTVNAVAIRPTRPLRAVTASDDFSLAFYSGTPYRFQRSIKDHGRFVQSVRYAPDGSRFASCGADGKVFLYDGESGEKVLELVDPSGKTAHSSGVLALAWSPNSKSFVSVSMDGQVKAWGLQSDKEASLLWTASVDFEVKQIVGCAWSASGILVLSLSGAYAILNPADGIVKIIYEGHQKGYSALTIDMKGCLVSASYDGNICEWDERFKAKSLTSKTGVKPGNQVEDLVPLSDKLLAITSLDARGYEFKADGSIEAASWLEGKRGVKVGSLLVILNPYSVALFDGSKCLDQAKIDFSVAHSLAAIDTLVAVGLENKEILLFDIESARLTMRKERFSLNFGAVSALAFSEDGSKLAAGDDQRRLKVYDTVGQESFKSNWCYHNAKISCVVWLKGAFSEFIVTGSLDNSLMLWSLKSPIKPVMTLANAHSGPIVSVVAFADGRFASASQDGSIKIWSIAEKQ